jgi:UDP-glucuronate decarboxylase
MHSDDLIFDEARKVAEAVKLRQLAGKTVLVTGASGLLGTYFVASLASILNIDAATRIVAVTGHGLPDHLVRLRALPQIEEVAGDLTESDSVSKLPLADVIIHAAGYGQPSIFLKNPVKTLQLNTSVTLELFSKLKPGGVFLYLSSSEVYSGLESPPFSEHDIGTTNPMHPRSCYIESKRCGEAICHAFSTARGTTARVARVSLVYGPGTRRGDARVLNSFIERALQKGQIELLDDGAAKRTYCYVTDALEIMWRIVLGGKDFLYNVGGLSPATTIYDLAMLIGSLLDVPVRRPSRAAGLAAAPGDVRLNMEKAKAEFGQVNFVPLQTGLANTVEWQKSLYRS